MTKKTVATIDAQDTRIGPEGPHSSRQRTAGVIASIAAPVWLAMLVVEFRFGLFPDAATGAGEVANQLGFYIAMIGYAAALALLWGSPVTGAGWFAKFAPLLAASGLAVLVAAGVLTLGTGHQDSWLFPIGGLAMMLGHLLTGIVLAWRGHLRGWHRAAAIAWALSPIVTTAFELSGTGSNFLAEVLWPVTWLALGFALIQDAQSRSGQGSTRARVSRRT